jgi:hypothetical protein
MTADPGPLFSFSFEAAGEVTKSTQTASIVINGEQHDGRAERD